MFVQALPCKYSPAKSGFARFCEALLCFQDVLEGFGSCSGRFCGFWCVQRSFVHPGIWVALPRIALGSKVEWVCPNFEGRFRGLCVFGWIGKAMRGPTVSWWVKVVIYPGVAAHCAGLGRVQDRSTGDVCF